MMPSWIPISLGVLLFATWFAAGCETAKVTSQQALAEAAEPLTFDDTVMLDNGVVQLGVTPSVGRVMHFGWIGGENLIWVNNESVKNEPPHGSQGPYYNYGGDKLWPTAQALWDMATGNKGWPPDGTIDGGPWQIIEQSDRAITIESQPSNAYGIVVRRTFTLSEDEPTVTIDNVYERVKPNPMPLIIWSVTQINPPDRVWMDQHPDRPMIHDPYLLFDEKDASLLSGRVSDFGDGKAGGIELELGLWGSNAVKVGTLGRWIAGQLGDTLFLQHTDYHPDQPYPELSSVQLYVSEPYSELELHSPMQHLNVGETLENTVTWRLMKLSETADPAAEFESLSE
jgi:hypothetical protein